MMTGPEKTGYPELMSEKELARSFRELDAQMEQLLFSRLRDPKKRVEILEKLTGKGGTQRRCAVLLMLSRQAQMIGGQGRLFLLPHLLDLLSDESGAIRLGIQDCAGRYIAMGCGQDPNIWAQSLRKILFDGKGSAPAERIRTGNALGGLLRTVYENAPEEDKKAILSVYGGYFKSTKWDRISCASLLKGIFDLPHRVWGTMQRGNIIGFVRYFLKNDTGEVRLAALVLLSKWKREGWKPSRDFDEYLQNVLEATVRETKGEKGASAIRFLASEIGLGSSGTAQQAGAPGGAFRAAGMGAGERGAAQQAGVPGGASRAAGMGAGVRGTETQDGATGSGLGAAGMGAGERSGAQREGAPEGGFDDAVLFRENLDSNVPDLVKYTNLRILAAKYAQAMGTEPGFAGYYAHLLIFMRLNKEAILFQKAGEDLLAVMERMAEHQKQEIMAELLQCVEKEEDSAHYLPYLIGQCWLHIPESMQRELVPEVQRMCNSDNPQAVEIIMGLASELLRHFSRCGGAQGPGDVWAAEEAEGGASAAGAADVLPEEDGHAQWIRQSMSGILCQGVYSDRRAVAESAVYTIGYDLYRPLDGRELAGEEDARDESERRLLDGAREPLVSVARSILLYLKKAKDPDPVYVYLTVRETARYLTQIGASYEDPKRPVAFFAGSFDPFSNGHRAVASAIAQMGFQVYISVDEFSWDRNTQPLDIRRKIVMLSIADLAHVRLFPREVVINPDNPRDLARLCALFPGQKVYLVCGSDHIEQEPSYRKAPSQGSVHSFPHIVFTRNMSETDRAAGAAAGGGERLTNLTGEVIYLKLPIYYEHMTSLQIRYNLQEGRGIDELVTIPARQYILRRNLYGDERFYKKEIVTKYIETRVSEDGGRLSVLLADGQSGEILGRLDAKRCGEEEDGKLFRELELLSMSVQDGGGAREGALLDEALLAFQGRGIDKAYAPEGFCGRELLKERGFVRISGTAGRYGVDLRSPLVLFGDASSCILEPFAGDPALQKVFEENEHRLRLGMAGLYPGSAVLFLDGEILTGRIARRICGGDGEQGEKPICVPFGKILKYMQFPGVVTMALNTEKVYAPDLDSFEIRESAGYPELSVQIGNLKSMDRPFVLVDDFYHQGNRMRKIAQSLRAQGLREERLVAGAVSGKGRAAAARDGVSVDAVYEIPNMKVWILESDMIPFYGGDRVEPMREDRDREEGFVAGRRPSIYPILPYQMPSFLKDAPYQAIYDLSITCLENALRLFEVLENIYESRFFRRLTLERLSEIIDDPGFPEAAMESAPAQMRTASGLLSQELIRLRRFQARRK